MKQFIALTAALALAAPAFAESRPLLVLVTHDKAGKAAVTVHSDEKAERRVAASLGEACKTLAGVTGWGSTVQVYVATDRPLSRADRKALFGAISENIWLDLTEYSREAPKSVVDHFIKR